MLGRPLLTLALSLSLLLSFAAGKTKAVVNPFQENDPVQDLKALLGLPTAPRLVKDKIHQRLEEAKRRQLEQLIRLLEAQKQANIRDKGGS